MALDEYTPTSKNLWKENENEKSTITRSNLFFANGGTRVGLGNDATTAANYEPIRYVVCLGTCTVLAAYAYRNIDGYKILSPIPASYYQIYLVSFGTVNASVAYFSQPLSSRDEGWENEVYFTVTSSLSNNVVQAMIYIIENYTNLNYDATTFNAAITATSAFPVNFAILDRPNALSLLQDMAYQSRCALWINNDTFYIKYLPSEDASVDTITEADAVFQSIVVSTTETEDIITKYTALWKADYLQSKDYKLILRYNISKYGIKERSFDYFIYNQEALVQVSSVFWLIRSANTFKKITFRTPLSKLKLEPFDTVTLNFTNNYVSTGPITGCLIEEANIDVDAYEIEFVIWVPVRLGEMTKYDFAYPGDLTIEKIYPTDKDIQQNRPGSTGIGKDAKLPETLNTGEPLALKKPITRDAGNGNGQRTKMRRGQLDRRDYGSFAGGDDDFEGVDPIGTRVDSGDIEVVDQPDETEVEDYQYKDFDLKVIPETTATTSEGSIVPAKVVSGSNNNYTVNAYYQGFSNAPTIIENVKLVGADDSEDALSVDTPGFLTKLSYTAGDVATVEYYLYVAVWG